MKLIYKICIGLLCYTFQAQAQSIERQVIANGGTSFTSSSGSIEFTIAETVTQSMSSANYNLSNGFHQPVFTITQVNQLPEVFGLTIFPNPSNQLVFVKFETPQQHTLIELCDLSGQVLQSNKLDGYQQEINLSAFANGAYYLKINQTQFYKIIKLQ